MEYQTFTTGGSPKGLTSSDFNGDAKPDLALTNSTANTMQVLINDGSGNFLPVVSYATGTTPESIVSTDFNGDSMNDIAVTNYASNSISVFINTGLGTFNPAVSYGVGVNPKCLTSTDLNGDGFPEIVCTNMGSVSIQVLLNNGTGIFSPQPSISASGQPTIIISGRFNNDTFNDIAYSCSNDLWIYQKYGNGSGTFTAPTYSNAGGYSRSAMVAADFNNDGFTDFAGSGGNGYITICINDGTGFFNTAATLVGQGGGEGMTAGDFNNDGFVDIGCSGGYNGRTVIIMNNGGLTFTILTRLMYNAYSVGIGIGVTAADFNSDGKCDFAIANQPGGNVWTFTNSAPGVFGVILPFNNAIVPQRMDYVDFNADGEKDLVMCDANSSSMVLMPGIPNNYFGPPSMFATPSSPISLTVDDFNGDGKPDVATANGFTSNFSVHINNGVGGFFAAVNYATGTGTTFISSGDFNNDSYPDLAIVVSNKVKIWMNNGSGVFSLANTYSNAGGGYSMVVIDLDGDGNLDLVEGCSTKFYIFLGSGSGTFAIYSSPATTDQPRFLTVADFNLDGILDVVTANFNSNNYSIFWGISDTVFQTPVYFGNANNIRDIKTCDYNQDNYPDFAVADYSYASVTIYENNQSGGFIPHIYGAGGAANSLLWADMNNDGKKDLLVLAVDGPCISLLLNSTSIVNAIGSTVSCANTPVTLVANLGAASYLWSPSGSTNDTLIATVSGNYFCTMTNNTGSCSSSSSPITVTINPNPYPIVTLDLSPIDTQCVSINTVILNGESPSGGLYSGTGVTGNQFSPSNSGAGTFAITYTYSDALGCTSTAVDSIFVDVCIGLETNVNNGLSVFPIPSSNQVNVEFNSDPSELIIVELVDMFGQTVKKESQETHVQGKQNIQLDICNISDGNYMLLVKTDNEILSKRIIISH